MVRRSPTKINRPKGPIKVKHVLQICLLLGICFWLIYQVKHSHDKKKEFDGKDLSSKLLMKSESDDGKIVKLGRKDLHPRMEEEEVKKSESRDEDDEEENRGEEEEQQKNEVEEEQEKEGEDRGEERRSEVEEEEEKQEGQRDKVEEEGGEDRGEERRNGVEEEEEANRQEGQREKVEEEGEEEQGEEKNGEVEEEHEQEEGEIKKKETEEDEERGGGDDEIDRHNQEKADSESEHKHKEEEEKEKEEEGDDKKKREEKIEEEEEEKEKGGEHENEHEAREEQYKADDASSAVAHNTHSTKSETDQVSFEKMDNESRSIVKGEINGIQNRSRLMEENVTSTENGNFSNPMDDSPLNSTLVTPPNDLPEVSNNLSESSGFPQKSSLNETVIASDLPQNSTILVKAENESRSSGTESDVSEVILRSNTTNENREETAGNEDSSSVGDSGREGDEESEGGPRDVVQDDPIDSSDLHVTEDMKDDRVDLDTLPDIRMDVDNISIEESAAE